MKLKFFVFFLFFLMVHMSYSQGINKRNEKQTILCNAILEFGENICESRKVTDGKLFIVKKRHKKSNSEKKRDSLVYTLLFENDEGKKEALMEGFRYKVEMLNYINYNKKEQLICQLQDTGHDFIFNVFSKQSGNWTFANSFIFEGGQIDESGPIDFSILSFNLLLYKQLIIYDREDSLFLYGNYKINPFVQKYIGKKIKKLKRGFKRKNVVLNKINNNFYWFKFDDDFFMKEDKLLKNNFINDFIIEINDKNIIVSIYERSKYLKPRNNNKRIYQTPENL